MAKDRYGEAIGFWNITVSGANFDIKLQMGDGRKLRNLLMENTKNKVVLFDEFSNFMADLIKRQYPEDSMERIKEYVEFNCLKLFEEAQVAFRFSTREELESTKKETQAELERLKNSIGSS